MRLFSTFLAAAALMTFSTCAMATPLVTLTFGGTITTGYDSSDFFGGGSITGDHYTNVLTYDPLAIGTDSCGTSTHTTSCEWSASGSASSFTDVLKVTVGSHVYTLDMAPDTNGSSFGLHSGGGDTINLSFGGHNFSVSLNASDTHADSLFANDADVNNPDLNFTNAALTNSSAEYGNDASTSFTLDINTISASYSSGVDPVPEPMSIALFGGALATFGWYRRRRR